MGEADRISPPPTPPPFYMLYNAVKLKRVSQVQKLLQDKRLDLSATDTAGFTALHHAVAGQSYDIVRLLVEHGADPGARNVKDQNCLHIAAKKGNAQIASICLEY